MLSRFIVVFAVLPTVVLGQSLAASASRPTPRQPAHQRLLWTVSVAALAAGNAVDIHSSWGKGEANRILAGPSGTFGGRGAAIKISLTTVACAVEWLLLRRHPQQKAPYAFTVVNFSAAGVLGGMAAHNYLQRSLAYQ